MNAANEILFVTSYPPRECGIATYSQDLMNSIKKKFGDSFSLKVAALESGDSNNHNYGEEVKYIIQTSEILNYIYVAERINYNENIKVVFVQHEFGLFGGKLGEYLLYFLNAINKKIIVTLHTVLPKPENDRKRIIKDIAQMASAIIVMTESSARILRKDYDIDAALISVIPHGTHLVADAAGEKLKVRYNLENKSVLTTFGLLSSGKSIETAIEALPAIVRAFPNVLYFILGKTHPTIVKNEGEKYREFLKHLVVQNGVENHVQFIDRYLSLHELLEYLQLTDIYLFTSKDPNQAVSGTFAYAMGCGIPVISTAIPQAREMLGKDAGIVIDFENPGQLSDAVIKLLGDTTLRNQMSLNALHKIRPSCWDNSAIAHANLCLKFMEPFTPLNFQLPEISLAHIKRMTTPAGIIQFSKLSKPDPGSGYTLDDNARALIALTWHYELNLEADDIPLIETYLNYIIFSQQQDGKFLNYIDIEGNYFAKNDLENLEDSNARAIWALGEFIAHGKLFHNYLVKRADKAFNSAITQIKTMHSPRALSFAINGLYQYSKFKKDPAITELIGSLADDLVSKYKHVSDEKWKWFEYSLTYANSIMPDALMYAYLATGKPHYKEIAILAFDFLLDIIFPGDIIKVISNNGWYTKGKQLHPYGEQPIDVAYTILSLHLFYETTGDLNYRNKIETAFSWFHGNNHLHQIIYNPATGGCCDGLEETHVNLNQGAESSVCYLMSRLIMEKYKKKSDKEGIEKSGQAYRPGSRIYKSKKIN